MGNLPAYSTKHFCAASSGACSLAPPAGGHVLPPALAAPPARRGSPSWFETMKNKAIGLLIRCYDIRTF